LKPYRLLVDLETIHDLNSLPKKTRDRILAHFSRLRDIPDRLSDFHEADSIGRRIEISIFSGFAIHYWIDFADRHIKILAVSPADR
jgi:hypothetical protein